MKYCSVLAIDNEDRSAGITLPRNRRWEIKNRKRYRAWRKEYMVEYRKYRRMLSILR